jgi:hypothetical protein
MPGLELPPRTNESKETALARIRADIAALPVIKPPSHKGMTPGEATELVTRNVGAN